MTFIGITPRSTDRGPNLWVFFEGWTKKTKICQTKRSKKLLSLEDLVVASNHGTPASAEKPGAAQMEVWGVGAVLFLGLFIDTINESNSKFSPASKPLAPEGDDRFFQKTIHFQVRTVSFRQGRYNYLPESFLRGEGFERVKFRACIFWGPGVFFVVSVFRIVVWKKH